MSKITSDYPSNMCQSMFDNSVSLKAVTMSCEGQSCGVMTLPSRASVSVSDACVRCRLDYYVPGILCRERFHLSRVFPLLGSLDVEITLFSFFVSHGENTRNLINNIAQSCQTRFGTCCWGNIKYFLT